MTRFGVMKHLKQLEEAGLVVTRRRGREKLHFLNPVPIRLVHDRWVSKYAEPWAAGLSGLKQELEHDDRWRRCSRSTSRPRPSDCGRRSPTRASGPSTTSAPAPTPTGRPGRASSCRVDGRRRAARRGRGARGRPATTARAHHDRPLQPRGPGRGHVTRHVGDRAGAATRAGSRWCRNCLIGR